MAKMKRTLAKRKKVQEEKQRTEAEMNRNDLLDHA
jgi:hypothetical protein